ncbi:MAG: hypothetical protein KKD05_04910 [Candidatus Omnitrophica bacterium]|nr:hypothetical protein [Candidatus Omnitrophota bacterium]
MNKQKKIYRLNLILISLLVLSNIALRSAQAERTQTIMIPEVKAQADKTTINIGDIIAYDLRVQVPLNAQLKFPAESDNKTFGIFEVRDFKEKKVNIDADTQQLIRNYKLTGFKVGEQVIPEYAVEYRLSDAADWQKISAPSIKINLESVLEKEAEQLSAKPLKPKLIIWRDFWGWVILLIAIGLIGLIVFLVKKYMVKLKAQPIIIIPAHIIALEELRQLQEQGLIAQGKIELYFEKLSGCMRHYLENRFHLRAPWMSTEEFLSKAKTSPVLTTEQKHLLHDFLILCDMVKFACYESSANEANDLFAIARNFVEQTKQIESDNKPEAEK